MSLFFVKDFIQRGFRKRITIVYPESKDILLYSPVPGHFHPERDCQYSHIEDKEAAFELKLIQSERRLRLLMVDLILYSTTIVTIECPWQGIIWEWDSDMSTSERCVRRFTRDSITSITLKTAIVLRETSSHITSHLRRSKRVVNVFTAQMGL